MRFSTYWCMKYDRLSQQQLSFLLVIWIANCVFVVQNRRRCRVWAIRRQNAKPCPTTEHVWTSTKQWIVSEAGRWLTFCRSCSAAAGYRPHGTVPPPCRGQPVLTSTSPRGTSRGLWS